MTRELCGCRYILHVTHGLGLCRLVLTLQLHLLFCIIAQILWSREKLLAG